MRVDISKLVGVTNLMVLDKVIDGMITASEDTKDPIFISDLLLESNLSEPLMAALRDDPRKLYSLRVLKDEWGKTPKPGDIVRRKHKKSLTRHGKLITSRELSAWKRAGVYEKNRYRFEEFEVGDNGCIVVNATDAEYFLSIWGIHSASKAPISHHQETSGEPAKCPDGKKRLVHYWRYEEAELIGTDQAIYK